MQVQTQEGVCSELEVTQGDSNSFFVAVREDTRRYLLRRLSMFAVAERW
jgi:hypothetical protein